MSNMLGFFCVQGFCPGLSHGQRYGISYVTIDDHRVEDESTSTKHVAVVENYPVLVVTNHSSDVETGPDNPQKPNEDQREEPQVDNRAETDRGGD